MKTLTTLIFLCVAATSLASIVQRDPWARYTEAEKQAIIRLSQYPDMANASSVMRKEYDALLRQAISAESVVFSRPDWPMQILDHLNRTKPFSMGTRSVGGRSGAIAGRGQNVDDVRRYFDSNLRAIRKIQDGGE